jgi:hypothetical protein
MLTALLLLLGLSGAGAGLYSVLKEPEEEKKPSQPSQPRQDSQSSKEESRSSGFSTKEKSQSGTRNRQPESLPLGDFGKPEEPKASKSEKSPLPKGLQPPKITYPVDEIISRNSKFSHHRRPIINAEALVEKLNIDGAIELYQRSHARIPDEPIQEKIRKNISDLKEFKEKEQELEDLYSGLNKEGEGGVDFDPRKIPMSGPIPIRDLADAIREISEALTETLQRGFLPPQFSLSPGNFSPPASDSASFPPTNEPFPQFNRQLPEGYFPSPIVYQFVTAATPIAPSNDLAQPSIGFVPSNLDPNFPQFPALPPLPDKEVKEKQGIEPLDYPEKDLWDQGILDLPEDTFFSRDWEKFRNLPLTDRRSGEERRKTTDRRTGLNRKDRRSGEDRRKVDLFKQREEYLKKKAEEKKLQADQKKPIPGALSDAIEPFYPPEKVVTKESEKLELTDINLPDPDEYKVQDGRIIRILIEPSEIENANLPDPESFSIEESPHPILETPTIPISQPFPLPEARQEQLFPQNPEDYVGLPDPEYFELESSKSNLKPDSEIPPLPSYEPPIKELPSSAKEEIFSEFELPTIGLPDPEVQEVEPLGEGVISSKTPEIPSGMEDDQEIPDIEVVDGDLDEQLGEIEPELEEKEPEKILHGVLELKPPEVDDAPFLTLTYDFGKIPHGFRLSRNYSIMEYSYYKYKPMLMKAQEFARRKMLKNALNYYRVVKSQNIPPEMRKMINRNIRDITEFMEKFLMAKGG